MFFLDRDERRAVYAEGEALLATPQVQFRVNGHDWQIPQRSTLAARNLIRNDLSFCSDLALCK